VIIGKVPIETCNRHLYIHIHIYTNGVSIYEYTRCSIKSWSSARSQSKHVTVTHVFTYMYVETCNRHLYIHIHIYMNHVSIYEYTRCPISSWSLARSHSKHGTVSHMIKYIYVETCDRHLYIYMHIYMNRVYTYECTRSPLKSWSLAKSHLKHASSIYIWKHTLSRTVMILCKVPIETLHRDLKIYTYIYT